MHLTLLSTTLLLSLHLIAAHADCTFDPPADQQTGTHKTNNSGDKSVMIEALKVIAPRSAQDPCVDNKEATGECRSAAQAAEPIINSFKKYKIESPAEKAALLSLMAFETGEFAYRKNHYPGRPGQGSMFNFISHYNVEGPIFVNLAPKAICKGKRRKEGGRNG